MTTPSIDVAVHSELAAIVTLHGEYDLALKPELVRALERARLQRNVVVDFTHCAFADMSVVSALLQAAAHVQSCGGQLEVVVPPQRTAVHRVFEVLGLQQRLPMHATLSAAVREVHAVRPATDPTKGPGMRLRVIAVLAVDTWAADGERLRPDV
jgi:anti-anti-sigma factor